MGRPAGFVDVVTEEREGGVATPFRPSVCFVSTYPPSRCGLASHTEALIGGLRREFGGKEGVAVARVLTPTDRKPSRQPEVVGTFRPDDDAALGAVARSISRYDLAVVQHEFGIYGPDQGIAVLDLVDRLQTKVVTVLHTVPLQPTPERRAIVESLLEASHRVVTLSGKAAAHLESGGYEVSSAKVEMVPHGIRFVPRSGTAHLRPTILTWGLLARHKGLERGILAMSRLKDLRPPPLYLIVGRTHPRALAAEGEAYRRELEDLVHLHGLSDMVDFVPTYLDDDTLASTLAASEVVLLPYSAGEQVISGVLAEALGGGKPVVATRFAHAEELLSGGGGLVVEQGDIPGLAKALRRLLTDQDAYREASARALQTAKAFSWSETSRRWARLVEAVASQGESAVVA